MLKRIGSTLNGHVGVEDLRDYVQNRSDRISELVETVLSLVSDFDAFDVLDLMRQREISAPSMGLGGEAHAAAVEIIAVILLSRGSRTAKNSPSQSSANEHVEFLHAAATEILQLGNFSLLLKAEADEDGLADLQAQNLINGLNIRNLQYQAIHDSINELLFGDSGVDIDSLGFAFSDFIAVREAIRHSYESKFIGAVAELNRVASEWNKDRSKPQSVEEVENGRKAVFDAFLIPGTRASFSANEISQLAGVEIEKTEAVLNLFSVEFQAGSATQAVLDFIDGNNPFASAPLIRDISGNYIQVSVEIGTDKFRQVYEQIFSGKNSNPEYPKIRQQVSESLAVHYVQKILESSATYTSLEYFAPQDNQQAEILSAEAKQVNKFGKKCEADALFLVEDVAICVEVKGQSISGAAKQGSNRWLLRDLKGLIGKASRQAQRLETLIESNHGIWLADQKWLDLSHIHEVRSIVVSLEDVAPLSINVDGLTRAGIISGDKFPWIVSIHDLAVITSVLDRAPEFLLYLRRRTESLIAKRFTAMDELDLFMHFLHGGLYVEPDPDLIFKKYPNSVPPTNASRKLFRSQPSSIFVGSLTDELDSWINFGEIEEDVPKPTFSSNLQVLEIVDFLHQDFKPGWFRFAADLLNLSSESQVSLVENLLNVARRTRTDKNHHSFLMCFAGPWGFPSIYVYSRSPSQLIKDAIFNLSIYMKAKQHQLGSDRALGLVISGDGRILAQNYLNELPSESPELDELVQRMNLVSTVDMARPVPPSVKHKQKPKAKKRRKKKR